MKKSILGLLLVLCAFTTIAQPDSLTHSSRISISFGGAFPVGDFSSSDFEDTFTPFALSGPLAQISYLHDIKPYLAAGATLGLRRNAMDLDEFASDTDELVISKNSESWQSVFTLADLQFNFSTLTRNLYLKGSVGAAFNRSASLQVETPYGTINHAPDTNTSFAYGASAGTLINLNQFSLGLESGILSTRPTFKLTDAQGNAAKYKLSMTTINLVAFASYHF
ncbi:hypothetical protein H8S95_00645 [Pontibacter sp. KCTC 32443]|uniref:hypothetical protein n=1 Tax=Pontibacter TaxID=323449 RepID=UPI00164E4AC3|nr:MULTISPECIES: hypothetical protein [Pontibacter]MBC5772557.1 hypothetical protein [Pontibacter sp. KCTC 32443]